ncbi:hypothetical protein J1N35_001368, partial [Gossypium stocksii]
MRSKKGRKIHKNKVLKIESTKEKEPIICYECKKLGHIKFDCLQWKKKWSRKQKLKRHINTWSDKYSSDNEDQEVTCLFLMEIDDSK